MHVARKLRAWSALRLLLAVVATVALCSGAVVGVAGAAGRSDKHATSPATPAFVPHAAKAAIGAAAEAAGQAARVAALSSQINAQFAGLGGSVSGLAVISGLGTVFDRQAAFAEPPASNEKLFTAAAVLLDMGPGHTFTTALDRTGTAPIGDRVLTGSLVLVASGDPTLDDAQLTLLARQLAARGVHWVTGGLYVDVSHLDGLRSAPGWPASFVPADSGPLSAFMLDGNEWRQDAGYLTNPDLANLQHFAVLLAQAGVRVGGPIAVGRPPAAVTGVVASVRSANLASIVDDMLANSVNMDAEILLKDLGAATGHGGSTAGGAAAVSALAARLGIEIGRHVDGSGLSSDDRTSAATLERWLTAVSHTSIWPALSAGLPVSCTTGTLKTRLCGPDLTGMVHAKTGTLNDVATLTGYTHDAAGRLVRFAFMTRGTSQTAERAAIDRAVTVLTASAV